MSSSKDPRRLLEEADEFLLEVDGILQATKQLRQLVTNNPEMLALKARILKLAPKDIDVLIIGETGTGKELLARALHGDRPGEFVAVNAAAIPDNLLEAEFFGAVKGAYTGCEKTRDGFFAQANKGTLFLDEIGELPYSLQSKLLRVIQERTFRKVGSTAEEKFNCRIISATNIEDLAGSKSFRLDLYYRLAVTTVQTIPLRERREDIKLIVKHFDPAGIIPEATIEEWKRLPFEGNVRQLLNSIKEYHALHDL